MGGKQGYAGRAGIFSLWLGIFISCRTIILRWIRYTTTQFEAQEIN